VAHERWVWFALDSCRRVKGGEHDADDAGVVRRVLRGRGLEPLLVLPHARWHEDLAGGPPGVPPPVRTAAEIAMLRAEGALELPPMSAGAAERFGVARRRPGRRRWFHHGDLERERDAPQPMFAVHARPWSRSLVSVAVLTSGGEALRGTERLFPADDDGLAAAAEWKGQLKFVCEQWLLDGATADGGEAADDGPDAVDEADAHAASRLLDD
jgi:hypothetical protein